MLNLFIAVFVPFVLSGCSPMAGFAAQQLLTSPVAATALLGGLANASTNPSYGINQQYSGYYEGNVFHQYPQAPKGVGCLDRPQADYSGCWSIWDTYQYFQKPPPPTYVTPRQVLFVPEEKKSVKPAQGEEPACVKDGRCAKLE